MTLLLPVVDEAEVVVIGGGPAGAVAAFTLASAGHDVTIIDKCSFPRDKPCGDGVTSSAVSFLADLGLEEALDGARLIDSVRLCLDWKEHEVSPMRTRHAGTWAQSCTVPRKRFDNALVRLACSAGARLVHGHVEGPVREDGRVIGVEIRQRGTAGVITARHVFAADGATSRVRRQLNGHSRAREVSSYAARTYVATEVRLAHTFEIYAPLADLHAGYGWMFPVADGVANVGIGYMTARGLPRPRPVTDLLVEFLGELQRNCGSKLGSLQALGSVSGAPVGINFSPEHCQQGEVIFAGDAARTCDPITGEGINQAMRGAHACAIELHQAIRRRATPVGIGKTFAQSYPRLGQDSAMLARLWHELVRGRTTDDSEPAGTRGTRTPLFSAARGMLNAAVECPSLAKTPAGQVAASLGYGDALGLLAQRLRDQTRHKLIFCSELLQREVCAGVGPIAALLLFATQPAGGGGVSERAVDAALAVELVRAYSTMLSFVTKSSDKLADANNALATMIGDYALSRATSATASSGTPIIELLAAAIEANSEGVALRALDIRNIDRPVRRYIESARLCTGSSLSIAGRIGARLAGATPEVECSLGALGEQLGIAVKISEDIVATAREDPVTGCKPWHTLERGDFTLPVILTLANEPRSGSLLSRTQDRAAWERAAEMLPSPRAVGEASSLCARYSRRAKQIADEHNMHRDALTPLCELPHQCLAPLTLLPSVGSDGVALGGKARLRLAS